ncbi:MAG: PP0621 family protein [Alcanivoracaceae bacterium]
MGLIRLIILAALIWLVWRILRQTLLAPRQPPPSADNNPQKMVRCAQCDVHVPLSEAVREGERAFCSDEHRRQWLEHHD